MGVMVLAKECSACLTSTPVQDRIGQTSSGLEASHPGVGLGVGRLALALSAVALALVTFALIGLVDGSALSEAIGRAVSDPAGIALIVGALLGAFTLRALAWTGLLPGLGFGSALAAIHLALGANHVLPFRLGEPLRVLAAVRRSEVGVGPATTTTVLLRSADVVSLLLLGLIAGPRFVAQVLGLWGLVAAAGLVLAGLVLAGMGLLVTARGRSPSARLAIGPLSVSALVLTTSAWLLEAVVVWRVASWFAVELSAAEALVVLAVAVGSQVLAVTPGGIGTYEAAATAALVATGIPVQMAVTLALTLHGVKTIYSLIAGAVALVRPRPGLAGRWRLPTTIAPQPAPVPSSTGPIVLFLPARNEGPRLGAVIAAAPAEIAGHPVEVVVVDDGSTDDTVAVARSAGAAVLGHGQNLGLGAAVRTGLAAGVERGAVAVAFCDADGEYDPAQLADLVTPILAGRVHYVVGSRFDGRIEHMRPHRRFGNRVLTRLVRTIVRLPVTDGQSGYRALSAAAAASVEIAHDYNYAQVLTIDLVGRGFGYHEVPITYRFRTSGRSFVRLGPYLARVVPTVWRQLNPSVGIPPTQASQEHPSWSPEPDSSPLPSP